MPLPLRKVWFRVDASSHIGSGHLMRCLTLAGSMQAAGVQVVFICRDLPGNYVGWLRQRGQQVCLLPPPAIYPPAGADEYLAWLGVAMDTEIAQSRAILGKLGAPDWLVVDQYALNSEWERGVCPRQTRLMAIDDLANRPHSCTLLLDQNYYPEGEARYRDLVGNAQLLLGPTHTLLRPDFATNRKLTEARNANVRRLLVFMGGSDSANVTATVLRALAAFRNRGLEVEVITGQSNPHSEEIASLCKEVGVRQLLQVDDMARRMALADLAIGATGVATWERACLGLPTLAVSVSNNQRDIARHAQDLGILRWLGDAAAVEEKDWAHALEWALASPEALQQQSMRGMELVDGQGVARVVESMLEYHRRLH